jgi:hypothetical protein
MSLPGIEVPACPIVQVEKDLAYTPGGVSAWIAHLETMPRGRANLGLALLLFAIAAVSMGSLARLSGRRQLPPAIQNKDGLRLLVADENSQPTLRIVLPEHADSDRTITVLFPEHVTARKHSETESEHLYVFRPGASGQRPPWRQTGPSLEYEKDLPHEIHMLAQATLERDGVRFRYEFANRSTVGYDMIYAVTDPRLTSIFHDVRLERTYVHHRDGFDLLASETPERLTIMPLNQWLPARYLASFTWAVPSERVEHREDGITYYTKSRAVDEPLIATFSTDRKWVVASFTRETGNVWSNPELTCQHVDPQTSLPPGQSRTLEVKILIVPASLDQVLQKVIEQRSTLR